MEENGTITHEIKGTGPSMTKFYILRWQQLPNSNHDSLWKGQKNGAPPWELRK
jgi:hypothetical protein